MRANDSVIRAYATQFKNVMMDLKRVGAFEKDCVFRSFPRGCCGDTCNLLAEFLLSKGIETIYVSGDFNGQSHAWLVVKDDWIIPSIKRTIEVSDNIGLIYFQYGGASSFEVINYTEDDIINGLIIDITADQFGKPSVYVGYMDDFYQQFEFDRADDYNGLQSGRLKRIYDDINKLIR